MSEPAVALLFAGQGSQTVGMMKDLYEQYDFARSRIEEAEEILGFPLRQICFEGPEELLQQTRYTQPALYVHESILYDLIKDLLQPSAVAGHSLGEYAALYAAGVFTFEDGLHLVKLRGELMYKAGEERPGTMAAVIGLPAYIVENICMEISNQLQLVLVPANYNANDQIVISGDKEAIEKAEEVFLNRGAKRYIPLKVSGAFHSPLMEPARAQLEEAIRKTPMNDAQCDVYPNVTARAERNAEVLRTLLIQQLTSPVLWVQTLQSIANAGILSFVEVGPGRVLQGLVKRSLVGVQVAGISNASHVHALSEHQTNSLKEKKG